MLSTACICTSQQPSHSDTQAWEGRGGALRQHTPEHSSFMGSLHWSSTTLQQPSAAGQGVLAFLPADLFTGVLTLPRRITQGYNLTKLWDGRNVQWPEGDVSVISVQLWWSFVPPAPDCTIKRVETELWVLQPSAPRAPHTPSPASGPRGGTRPSCMHPALEQELSLCQTRLL